ncbi:MAG: ATP-binding protein [Tissierellia bacterium]|nr:ATP-binding protein [Tissierellia bacterium]
MYTRVKSLVLTNNSVKIINIEANVHRGMFAFSVLGVPSNYEKKIRTKINSIFKINNQKLPNKKMIFNIEKIDGKYDYDLLDLPIFVAVLKILKLHNFNDEVYVGSLGINGDLLALDKPYAYINYASDHPDECFNIPYYKGLIKYRKQDKIFMYKNISHLLKADFDIPILICDKKEGFERISLDINDIIGQERLIRAIIISLVGRHHILVSGVAGTGKSLSFQAAKSILPDQDFKEQFLINQYTDKENSFSSKANFVDLKKTTSINDLFGSKTKKSILTMNQGGFLIFDEINLYPTKLLNSLKTYMDLNNDEIFNKEHVTIFANQNPCPCGNYGSKFKECKCSVGEIGRFSSKINKPFSDRFHIRVKTDSEFKPDKKHKYDIDQIRNNIKRAWNMQKTRYGNQVFSYNGFLNTRDLNKFIKLDENLDIKLTEFVEFYKLSIREKHNIIRVARSIADYEQSLNIEFEHLFEALSYQIN